MKNVIFFIDGFNLYHAIKQNPNFKKYKWIDLYKLSGILKRKDENLVDVYYFTAYAYWDKEKKEKHKRLVKALKSVNTKIVFGKFKEVEKRCRICKRTYKVPEEKETDVNIAIYLFKLAMGNKFDRAYIISGDSDLVPAIKAIKNTFPRKEICVVIPINRRAKHLKQICDTHIKMKEIHLISSRFPDNVTLPDKSIITCPPSWK